MPAVPPSSLRRRYAVCLFVALAGCIFPARTQTPATRSLELNFGAGHLLRQDRTFSPFVHADWSLNNFSLRFSREKRWIQWLEIGAAMYDPSLVEPYPTGLDDPKTTTPHAFNLIDVDYALGKPVWQRSRARLAVGGILQNDVQPSTYSFAPFTHFGYFASFGLGVWARYEFRPAERHTVRGTLRAPLAAWQARSPYLINDDEFIENTASHRGLKTFLEFVEDGDLRTWNTMQQLDARIDYHYRLGRRWGAGAAWEWAFLHATRPTSLRSFRNSLLLNLRYSF